MNFYAQSAFQMFCRADYEPVPEVGYVILTSDLDFGTILAVTHGEKPSVVQLRSDNLSHENIGKQVIDALRQLTVELEGGALVTVDTERTRLRILPLRTNTEE